MGRSNRQMVFTKAHFWALFFALNALYWVPALIYPEQVKSTVNAVYFLLAAMTTFMLIPDMWDIAVHRARISWQAATAKVGLFVLMLGFTCARMWGFVVGIQDFPRSLLESPVGGYFTYVVGLGILGVFYGFNSAGELRPKVTVRGTALVVLAIGIIIGLILGRIPS